MIGWVDLDDWLHRDGLSAHRQTVTHPTTNVASYGRDSNSQPVDHKSDDLATTPPSSVTLALQIDFFIFFPLW